MPEGNGKEIAQVFLERFPFRETPMLGESHWLVNELPEMEEIVVRLTNTDQMCAELNDRYNALDEEIRRPELKDAPITDNAMRSLNA